MNDVQEPDYLEVAEKEGWVKPAAQERSREMCERILEAAYTVFSENGYQNTNVSEITRLAGCSVGIFYKRFADKEGLFFTLQHRYFRGSHRRFDLILDASDSDTTSDIFRGFVKRTLNAMIANQGFVKAQVELSLKDSRVAKARMGNIVYAADRLMQVLVERGELPDTEELRSKLQLAVRVVFATITHLVLFGAGPYPVKDKRMVDNLVEILIGFLHEEQQRLGIS
jgi:AcrR family transcriptional regulator